VPPLGKGVEPAGSAVFGKEHDLEPTATVDVAVNGVALPPSRFFDGNTHVWWDVLRACDVAAAPGFHPDDHALWDKKAKVMECLKSPLPHYRECDLLSLCGDKQKIVIGKTSMVVLLASLEHVVDKM
jgi:hypothetical protein